MRMSTCDGKRCQTLQELFDDMLTPVANVSILHDLRPRVQQAIKLTDSVEQRTMLGDALRFIDQNIEASDLAQPHCCTNMQLHAIVYLVNGSNLLLTEVEDDEKASAVTPRNMSLTEDDMHFLNELENLDITVDTGNTPTDTLHTSATEQNSTAKEETAI